MPLFQIQLGLGGRGDFAGGRTDGTTLGQNGDADTDDDSRGGDTGELGDHAPVELLDFRGRDDLGSGSRIFVGGIDGGLGSVLLGHDT